MFIIIRNNSTLDPILIQINPGHTLTNNFFKIHFNIVFPSMLMSSTNIMFLDTIHHPVFI
jgi:hypothetical protein